VLRGVVLVVCLCVTSSSSLFAGAPGIAIARLAISARPTIHTLVHYPPFVRVCLVPPHMFHIFFINYFIKEVTPT